jgi:hypothetical protein
MRIADAKAVLTTAPYPSCFVRLFENGRWKQSGQAQLALAITSGVWVWRPQVPGTTPDLLLMNDSKTDWALEFDDVPKDFFKQLCGKPLAGDGLANNPNMDPLRYTFFQGCPSQDATGATGGGDGDDDE